jgi:hypothetical protein
VDEFLIEICGRPVPAIKPTDGVRAVIKNKSIEPKSVERYLESKFGDSFGLYARRCVTSRTPSD